MAKQNQDENLITLVDEQGNETLYQELFNFHSDDYDKSYILLIPAGSEPEEQVDVLAFAFNPDDNIFLTTNFYFKSLFSQNYTQLSKLILNKNKADVHISAC